MCVCSYMLSVCTTMETAARHTLKHASMYLYPINLSVGGTVTAAAASGHTFIGLFKRYYDIAHHYRTASSMVL